MTDPVEVWTEFAQGATSQGVLLKRVRSTPPSDLHLGMRFPGRHPLFVARVDDLALADAVTQDTTALRCQVDRTEMSADRTGAVVVELLDPSHTDIFGVLVSDLIARLSDGLQDGELLTVLSNRLTRWQQLLRTKRVGLTKEAQRGLFGELLFLRQQWDAGADSTSTLESWVGPGGAAHDWESRTLDVEVKARASTRASVRISSEHQLDSRSPDTDVFLLLATIDSTPDGESLPDLVDDMRGRVSSGDRDRLESRLFEYGWMDVHRARYEGTSWSLRDMRAFGVSDSFPRLIESALPEGIHHVSYALDVAAMADHAADLGELVRRMVEDGEADGT